MAINPTKDDVARLLTEHQGYIRRAAYHFVRGTPLDADEIVQRTNERVLLYWPRWKGFAFKKWVHKILFNQYLVEKEREEQRRGVSLDDEAWGNIEDPAPVGADNVTARLDFDRALALLSPRYREVFVLITIKEYSYEEAAEALDIPVGTVTSRLKRARRRYAAYLSLNQDPDEA